MTGRSRAIDVVSLLKAAYNPVQNVGSVPPPILNTLPTQVQSVSWEMELTTVPQIFLQGEQVPNQNGAIIQIPHYGASAIAPWAFIPAGTTSQYVSANPQLWPNANIARATITNLWAKSSFAGIYSEVSYPVISIITFNDETPVPFSNGSAGSLQIQAAPADAEKNYSAVRLYASAFQVLSNTVATGTAELAGTLAGAAISDTRQVAQITGSASFAPSQICQSAMTEKDGIRNVRADRGITAILGCDVPNRFQQYVEQNVDFKKGSFYTYPVTAATTFQFLKGPAPNVISYAWVSPWNTSVTSSTLGGQQYDGGPGFGATYSMGTTSITRITPDLYPELRTGLTDVFDFRVRMMIGNPPTVGPILPYAQDTTGEPGANVVVPWAVPGRISFQATHCFVTVLTTGQLSWTFETEETAAYQIDQYSMGTFYYAGGTPAPQSSLTGTFLTASFSPRMTLSNIQTQGVYVGSSVLVLLQAECPATFNQAYQFTNSSFSVSDGYAQVWNPTVFIDVAIHGDYVDGVRGPIRIVRWDNIAGGAVVKMVGSALLQGIPNAQAQSLIKSQKQKAAPYNTDINAMLLITYLFNCHPMYCRVMPTDQWARMADMLQTLTPEDLVNSVGTNEQAVNALQTAGFFDAFNPVGNIMQQMDGAPRIRQRSSRI